MLVSMFDCIELNLPKITHQYIVQQDGKDALPITIVADEFFRLKSHIKHMKETLESADGIGRKLDFIAQEMNREANTILSKANDLEVSNHAIDLKTEIEKVREQIQNIE